MYPVIFFGHFYRINPIHHQGLRLALGAFRISPVASLYVEAEEPSLTSRREKLSLQYAIRLADNPSNPAHEVTFPPKYTDLYENNLNQIILSHLVLEFYLSWNQRILILKI